MSDELKKPYISQLKRFLEQERQAGHLIYPPDEEVFNAFRQTPYQDVRVVIMGQDPYHGPGQAHGLCFSVRENAPIPPSLSNIYKELQSDLGIALARHGCLIDWARQGVLLLNATLTVRAKMPKSHFGKGWEQFTDAVIQRLAASTTPLVFILWGRSAQAKCEHIVQRGCQSHQVLTAAHPSPYSASLFFGCRHFSQTNQWLIKWNKKPIEWAVSS